MPIQTVNPATGTPIATYDEMSAETVGAVIDQTHEAFRAWRCVPISKRAAAMEQAGRILLEKKDVFGRLITEEMGKTFRTAVAEVEKCALGCRYYAENAEGYLASREVPTEMARSYVAFRPLGVIMAVMPWNFPFWQVFRFAAPCLMAGNGAVLKHASNTMGSALAIEGVFRDAGFPENLFRTLVLPGPAACKALGHEKIRGVALTGSEATGRVVGAEAGRLLKKVVLELGGSDPYLILEDQDEQSLDRAADICVQARMLVSGQVCISAKRLIVVDSVREAFTQKVREKLECCRFGDPMDDGTDIGPLAREDLRAEVHGQVLESVKKGARLMLGGEIPVGPGFYYPPTLLTDVTPDVPAYEEEIFGPVASILPARDEADAVRIANDTRFGLGAAVFTNDVKRGEAIAADELQAGSCMVNTAVASDPRLPFGGIKSSGHGRELSQEGIREFCLVKTVCVK